MLDATHEAAEGHFRSLEPGFTPQVPVGADLKQALEHLLGQALAYQFPDHPHFEREVKKSDCEKVLAEVQKAARVEDGRVRGRQAAAAGDQAGGQPAGPGPHGRAVLRAGEDLADPLQQAARRREEDDADGRRSCAVDGPPEARRGWPPRSATC